MRRNLSTLTFALVILIVSGVIPLTAAISFAAYTPVRLTIPSQLPRAVQGKVFSYSFASRVTGGTGPPYLWKLTGNLPLGITLGLTTGKLTGAVSKSAKVSTYAFKICATGAKRPITGSAQGNTACQSSKIAVVRAGATASPNPNATGTIRITTTELPSAIEGQVYRTTIAAVGGTGARHCALQAGSSFPLGYAFVPDTCIISGRGAILASGTTRTISAPFTIVVTDSANPPARATITLMITTNRSGPVITMVAVACQALVPCGNPVIARANGGTQPYKFVSTQFAGGLPPLGMNVVTNNDGLSAVLTGTPQNPGTTTVGVCAVDTTGKESCQTVLVVVGPAPNFTVTVNKSGDDNASVSANPGPINCGLVCQGNYPGGTMLTITATASSGKLFTNWSGDICTSAGTCSFRVTRNTLVTANFVEVATGTYSGNVNFPNLNPSGYTGCEANVMSLSITLQETVVGKITGDTSNGRHITGTRDGSAITVTMTTIAGQRGPYTWQWNGAALSGTMPAFCTDNVTGAVINESSYNFNLPRT